jgi:phosphoglycolate phosphatase
MSVLRPPSAVLFDWDNTLADNWDAIGDALNTTLVAMGHAPWSAEEVRERVRASLRDSFPQMFGERWMEARQIFYGRFRQRHLAFLKALPGAGATLRALAARDMALGVVSNKSGDLLRREVSYLGWHDLFGRAVVGAGDAPRDKPAADPVEKALAPLGLKPSGDVWFVGDAGIDMACAKASGCLGVLIGSDPEAPEFSAYPPGRHVAGFRELLALVGSGTAA